MKKERIAAIAFAAALAQFGGCSKVTVQLEKPKHTEVSPAPIASLSAPTAAAPISVHQTPAERIVEIDRLLSEPLTGQPDDSDRRIALRAERAALADSYNIADHSTNASSRASQMNAQGSTQQSTNGDIVNYAPQRPPQNRNIVGARDSRAEQGNLPELEAMTPSERERYFRYLRLTRPQIIR